MNEHALFSPARLERNFYTRDVLEVAPDLLGKILVCKTADRWLRFRITETEAYRGAADLACHASKGRTQRTEAMFLQGGVIYMYLIYGTYWMFNVVTGEKDNPQAVLVRGLENTYGPGRLTRLLHMDKNFYGEDMTVSPRIWAEDDGLRPAFRSGKRIGVDYAGEWRDKPWRFFVA
ncbi:MAG: DNA-3-methyladenine glycosylase [Bacteroidales bacterium]|jgi:DNA-3-methyladenine glycosylase|nr:DNA-3-methyladenine glycosylase [Bacteroidales bacterium]